MGVCEAILGEKVCRRLVFAPGDELGLDARLVQGVAQECGVGGEATSPTLPEGCIQTSPNAEAR